MSNLFHELITKLKFLIVQIIAQIDYNKRPVSPRVHKIIGRFQLSCNVEYELRITKFKIN